MKEIDREKAFALYEDKIKECTRDELISEVKYLFFQLHDAQLLELLKTHKLSLLAEYGIDEKILEETIEKLSSGEYYVRRTLIYSNNYWSDDDYVYTDSFDTLSTLKEAIEYCYVLNEYGKKEKALKIGKALLSLEINLRDYDEYDDDYYDIDTIGLVDYLYYLEETLDIDNFKYLMLSIIVNQDYSYNELIWIINQISSYKLKAFADALLFIEDKSKCRGNLMHLMADNFKWKGLKLDILPKILSFLDDVVLFEKYAYNFKPISSELFEKYYMFMQEKGLDTSIIIKDAMKILPKSFILERFSKLAIELDDTNDNYKVLLYESNPSNMSNFFELYAMKSSDEIPSIVKGNLHMAMATLKDTYVNGLSLCDALYLLEALTNKFYNSDYSQRTLENIARWRESHQLGSVYLDNLYLIVKKKLDKSCDSILGSNRDQYNFLATCLYRLDRILNFSNNLRESYSLKYKKYRSFLNKIENVY